MLIGFGNYATWVAQGALEQGMDRGKIYTFNMAEKEKIVSILKNKLPENSIVFLKGSRGMQMEDIAQNLTKTKESGEKSYNV
jgi:UDP-N-acetylmuramyl pentapeptide synthase